MESLMFALMSFGCLLAWAGAKLQQIATIHRLSLVMLGFCCVMYGVGRVRAEQQIGFDGPLIYCAKYIASLIVLVYLVNLIRFFIRLRNIPKDPS